MELSHSTGEVPLPVDGNDWLRSHRSTSLYVVPEPDQICVRTAANRITVKNDGLTLFGHEEADAEQSRSHGVSGQFAVFGDDVHAAPDQHEVKHRSAVSNSTRAGGVEVASSDPARIPYSMRIRYRLRVYWVVVDADPARPVRGR